MSSEPLGPEPVNQGDVHALHRPLKRRGGGVEPDPVIRLPQSEKPRDLRTKLIGSVPDARVEVGDQVGWWGEASWADDR